MMTCERSVLREIGFVQRCVPGPDAPATDVAAWYRLKAQLWEKIAAETTDKGEDTAFARHQAEKARQRAERLVPTAGEVA